jgi:glycosyltransferase involved in cell wall biosynthesis
VQHIDILAVGHAPLLQINRRVYRALSLFGWKVELAIPAHLPWSKDTIVEPAHPDDPLIHRLQPRGGHIRFWWFKGLGAILDSKRPRIVYLENAPESVMAWRIGSWCRRNRAILVANTNENDIASISDVLGQRPRAALRSIRSQLWGRMARSRVDHVVAICEDGRKSMQAIGFADAVSVIPLGFDTNLFFPDAARRSSTRAALGLREPVVGYFGRLTPAKGVLLLIAALARLKDKSWQFLIDDFERDARGSGSWLNRAIAEAGISDRVVTFSASHEGIADYMRAADIAVLPSIVKEQYGRVVPEAMACGCAVIVSDIGALPELIGDAGVTVPPGDVASLSGTIADLLGDPQKRTDLASRAQVRARTELSLERQALLLNSLLARLAQKNRADRLSQLETSQTKFVDLTK